MSVYDNIKNKNVITIYQGSDHNEIVHLATPDPDYPKDRTKDRAFDLSGCTVVSYLDDLDGNRVAEFECEVVEPPTGGDILRKLPRGITADLVPDTKVIHVWGIIITTSDADQTVLPQIQGGAMVAATV